MKRIVSFIIILSVGCVMLAWAQQPKANVIDPTLKTFLNDKKTSGGVMEADSILYYVNKPLFCQDSAGTFRQIIRYQFTYIERDVYYNENGRPYIGTEIMGAPSQNGIIPESWNAILKERLKSGDTVIFNTPISYYDFKDYESSFEAPKIVLVVK